jgi:hypothetical protein
MKDKNIIVQVKTVLGELDNPGFELRTTDDSSLRLVFRIMTPQFFIVMIVLEETATFVFFRIYFYPERDKRFLLLV